MSARDPMRRLLLAGAVLAAGAGAALFWQHGQRTANAFEPSIDDVCVVPPAPRPSAHPYDPTSGRGIHEARPIPSDARCAVCGMYPARFPRWAAQLIFADGAAHFFDSPVDLFIFLADPRRFGSTRDAGEGAALYVTDFGDGRWLDARTARFVLGSRIRGPMRGPDLPAFADAAAAQAFIAEHGGRALRFDEVEPAVVDGLRSANHAHHTH